MKQYLISLLLFVTLFAVISCDEANPLIPLEDGELSLTTTPDGALIYLNGTSTEKTTPATIKASEGSHEIKLVKENYADTTFTFGFQAKHIGVVSIILQPIVGTLSVKSNPVGVAIWLDGTNTGKITPHVFQEKALGNYEVVLKADNYEEYKETVTVGSGIVAKVDAELTPLYSTFSNIKLWETVGTTAAQPSGLDLSSGKAYGISDANNRGNIDLYYFSSSDGNTYLVQSAHINNNMTRETFFNVAAGSDLSDGVDSPVKDGNWTSQINDREAKYVFLYDADGNYTKFQIVNYGGGNVGEPAWVEVSWIYNKAVGNTKF